jgi:hypothetical protein
MSYILYSIKNFPWKNLCTYAATGGHFAILKWARRNGYHWNESVCYYDNQSS